MPEERLDPSPVLRPDLPEIVSRIWRQALGPKGRVPRAHLVHIGVGAKRVLRLLDEIEAATGRRIPVGIAFKLGTPEAITDALRSGHWPAPSPLVVLKQGSDRCPVYIIPGGHCLAIEVSRLATAIDHPGKISALQPPGLEGEPGAFVLIEDLAAYYVDRLPGDADDPVSIVGYSGGGLIAVEMARILEQRRRRIGRIVMVDTLPAERYWPASIRTGFLTRRAIARLRGLLAAPSGRRLQQIGNIIRPVRKRLTALFTTHPSVSTGYEPDLDPRLKPVKDFILGSREAYRPRPIAVPITLFCSKADRTDSGVDPAALWRPTVSRLEAVYLEGSHVTILLPPLVERLAAEISARLPRCPAALADLPLSETAHEQEGATAA
jgi:thioesterase domain-containing protein